ncbi:MAG: S8/S53 family peptidase [Telmatospirillum sp.]|nr:S8/S53 family peptidase [Telmatospirillum sp.]
MAVRKRLGVSFSALVLASMFAPDAFAANITQSPVSRDPGAVDLGLAPDTDVKTIALSLNVPDLAGLQAFVASTVDRTSPNFRKFLTPDQFAAQFGQSDAAIAEVTSYLNSYGITVTNVHRNHLIINARATNAQLAAAFGSPIHKFSFQGATYQRPATAAALPAALQGVVGGVLGLSTQAVFQSRATLVPNVGPAAGEAATSRLVIPTPSAAATTTPGSFTVADFAQKYNVTPLYQKGLTGAGTTLGILTFADFNPSDAFAYWSAVGLSVDPNRLTKVLVDGGSGDGEGGDETAIDVEQAGGLAPGANILLYEAPNTDAGALDLYSQAINENRSDTISVSWGSAEIANDPNSLQAYTVLFLQAAAQGTPISAASGDAGAYDINRANVGYSYPTCTTLLDVDFPASSPMILAAGGTTIPAVIPRRYGAVTVPTERAWGWDYLRQYYVTHYGQQFYYTNVFPNGGGGGVSVDFAQPSYQAGLPGFKSSAAGQSLLCSSNGTVRDLADLPVGFAGRNLPDVAMNADPFTGYLLYYGGSWTQGYGGTSFVAPQLNGVFSLLTQALGKRVGWPHPQLYTLFKTKGYGAGSPFRPITAGSNLFYTSQANFNPATGLGSLDVYNLAQALAAPVGPN